jgi:DNA-binding XRE family transcriptional regulator
MPKPNGSLIRSRRQELGIKTGTMAKTVGCSRQHLTNIESGWMTAASIELLNRLAVELKLSVDDLLDQTKAGAA